MKLDASTFTKGYSIIPIDFSELRNQCITNASKYFNQHLDFAMMRKLILPNSKAHLFLLRISNILKQQGRNFLKRLSQQKIQLIKVTNIFRSV